MSRIKGRGSNPRSHNNKPKIEGTKGLLLLRGDQWSFIEKVGNGNRNEGARRLIDLYSKHYPDSMPYPAAIADYLLRRIAAGDAEAEKHWKYMQSWAVDQAMDEVVAGYKTPSGAYIV